MKGSIIKRSPGSWSIIIDLGKDPETGKRRQRWHTHRGTRRTAEIECAQLITKIDKGEYVDAHKITVAEWIEQWLQAGAPGRKRRRVSQRTLERYAQLMRTHVVPALGRLPLQKLRAEAIDKLYVDLADAKLIASRTQHHVHIVFGACLATAQRKGLIAINPMTRVEQIPAPEVFDSDDKESNDIGEGLTPTELAALVAGFKDTAIYPVVVLAAACGARRNELLALRWSDLDIDRKTLRIERALEQTKRYGIRLKPPKTRRGYRTIDLDDGTIAVLRERMAMHQRLAAGIPDGAEVDLSLVRLPDDALMFPALSVSFTAPRHPRNLSREFADRAKALGFGRIRFHDLRGIHATALLDADVPVHRVAQRIGDDPAVLLRNYTKRKRSTEADAKLSGAIATMAAGFLGSEAMLANRLAKRGESSQD